VEVHTYSFSTQKWEFKLKSSLVFIGRTNKKEKKERKEGKKERKEKGRKEGRKEEKE
jgi:hypothetical protein